LVTNKTFSCSDYNDNTNTVKAINNNYYYNNNNNKAIIYNKYVVKPFYFSFNL